MTRKILSYYNKGLEFYENIKEVDNLSNADLTSSCSRFLKMCTINDAKSCVGREIRIIGEFDDEKGLIAYEEPVVLVDCDEILGKRFKDLYVHTEESESDN